VRPSCRKNVRWPTPPKRRCTEHISGRQSLRDVISQAFPHMVNQQVRIWLYGKILKRFRFASRRCGAVRRQELEVLHRTRGPEHPRTLRAISNLAARLDQEGNHAEAARQFRELWDIQRRVRGSETKMSIKKLCVHQSKLAEDTKEFADTPAYSLDC
jgi:hypothetical protein